MRRSWRKMDSLIPSNRRFGRAAPSNGRCGPWPGQQAGRKKAPYGALPLPRDVICPKQGVDEGEEHNRPEDRHQIHRFHLLVRSFDGGRGAPFGRPSRSRARLLVVRLGLRREVFARCLRSLVRDRPRGILLLGRSREVTLPKPSAQPLRIDAKFGSENLRRENVRCLCHLRHPLSFVRCHALMLHERRTNGIVRMGHIEWVTNV
jgi:hypothetical protein